MVLLTKSLSRFLALLAVLSLALFAFNASAQDAGAQAANEPTLAQIYQAANSGKLDQADSMIAQVLKTHPNSAKAHYVKAELSAREGKADIARQELATAEKLAPGLPFAKAESVQALRNQLSNANTTARTNPPPAARQMGAPADSDTARAPAQRSFPWGTLLVVAAIVAIGVMVLRRRTAAVAANDGYVGGAYGAQPGYGPGYPPPAGGVPPGYGPGYGPGYPQQPGMGSSIGRGLATGAAIGAGMVAAEALGHRMFGHEGGAHAAGFDPNANANTPSLDQIDDGMRRNLNSDMGGNDFGIADGGSWDDAGGGGDFGGGGGDWDS